MSTPPSQLADAPDLADQLKALGHPVRLEIIRHLSNCGHCCCSEVCDCLPLAQSTVSQHLDTLCKAGLVSSRQDGNRSRFSLNREALDKVLARMQILCADDCLKDQPGSPES